LHDSVEQVAVLQKPRQQAQIVIQTPTGAHVRCTGVAGRWASAWVSRAAHESAMAEVADGLMYRSNRTAEVLQQVYEHSEADRARLYSPQTQGERMKTKVGIRSTTRSRAGPWVVFSHSLGATSMG
jgi:hypothetical protein